MAKTPKKSSSSNSSRRKPMVPKAGVTRSAGRRYGCGGKIKN